MFDLTSQLKQLSPFDENEKVSIEKTLDFLKNSTNSFSRSNLEGHVTAGAFVCHTNGKILLNHHKATNMWFQFGGHSDGNSNSFEVAKREVFEECGLNDFVNISDKIFDVSHQLIDARPSKNEPEHIHYDINFFFLTNNENFSVSNESKEIKWVTLEEAKKLADPKDIPMQRMLKKYEIMHQK